MIKRLKHATLIISATFVLGACAAQGVSLEQGKTKKPPPPTNAAEIKKKEAAPRKGPKDKEQDKKQTGLTVKEFGLTFQPPKGLIREHEDVRATNKKEELYSVIVSLADDPKILERDIEAPSRSFRIIGVMSETSELTPEGQLTIAKSLGLPKDAVYSKDADFKVGGIPAKRLEYREKSRNDPEDGKGVAYVQYYFLRPKTIFTVSAGIVRGDDKAAQAYFREVDKAVAEMKFAEPAKK